MLETLKQIREEWRRRERIVGRRIRPPLVAWPLVAVLSVAAVVDEFKRWRRGEE